MSTQTTKKKLDDFNEYFKSYLALCEHFENISKGIDFELLKKVDIFKILKYNVSKIPVNARRIILWPVPLMAPFLK